MRSRVSGCARAVDGIDGANGVDVAASTAPGHRPSITMTIPMIVSLPLTCLRGVLIQAKWQLALSMDAPTTCIWRVMSKGAGGC